MDLTPHFCRRIYSTFSRRHLTFRSQLSKTSPSFRFNLKTKTVGGRSKKPPLNSSLMFNKPESLGFCSGLGRFYSVLSIYKKIFTFAIESVRYPSLTSLEHGILVSILKRETGVGNEALPFCSFKMLPRLKCSEPSRQCCVIIITLLFCPSE